MLRVCVALLQEQATRLTATVWGSPGSEPERVRMLRVCAALLLERCSHHPSAASHTCGDFETEMRRRRYVVMRSPPSVSLLSPRSASLLNSLIALRISTLLVSSLVTLPAVRAPFLDALPAVRDSFRRRALRRARARAVRLALPVQAFRRQVEGPSHLVRARLEVALSAHDPPPGVLAHAREGGQGLGLLPPGPKNERAACAAGRAARWFQIASRPSSSERGTASPASSPFSRVRRKTTCAPTSAAPRRQPCRRVGH